MLWQHDETGRIVVAATSPGPRWAPLPPLDDANITAADLERLTTFWRTYATPLARRMLAALED